MKISAVGLALGLAFPLAGCGGSGPQGVLAAPHGGVLVLMPDQQSYVEVVSRPIPSQSGPGQLVVYFLDLSRNPLNPPPTSASLKLRAARNPKPIELKPAEGGALQSPPLTDQSEIEGDLWFNRDGKPVSVPINLR